MGRIAEIHVKTEKGKPSVAVDKAVLLAGYGLEGDIYGGREDRQLSLMDIADKAAVKSSRGFCRKFTESITTEGLELQSLSAGVRLQAGETVIEIASVGKECYSDCPAHEEVTCGLAGRIAFARVVKGGEIRVGDVISRMHFMYFR